MQMEDGSWTVDAPKALGYIPRLRLRQNVDPHQFVTARERAEKYGGFLSATPPEKLVNHKLFLNSEGNVGYALSPEGDIQMLFSVQQLGAPPGSGKLALLHAIKNGGRTLDCFEGHLPYIYYNRFGFKEYKRIPWDDRYAPKNWNYQRDGRPEAS